MSQKIFIPIKFPSLNEYIGAMNRNRHAGNAMKRDFTTQVGWWAKMLKPVSSPVHITFTYQEANRKRDPDNITFAKKFILDGLVAGGVLPNDTQAWVVGFTETWNVNSDVGVEIILTEVENGRGSSLLDEPRS